MSGRVRSRISGGGTRCTSMMQILKQGAWSAIEWKVLARWRPIEIC